MEIKNCLITELNNDKVCALCKPGYYKRVNKESCKVDVDDDNINKYNCKDKNESEDIFRMLCINLATFLLILLCFN